MSQAAPNKPPIGQTSPQLQRRLRETGLILLSAIALFFLLALLTFHPEDPSFSSSGSGPVSNVGGYAGAWVADIALNLFGLMAYLLPALIVWLAWVLFHKADATTDGVPRYIKVGGFFITLFSGSGLAHIHFHASSGTLPDAAMSGGMFGLLLAEKGLVALFSAVGATLFLLALLLTGITLLSGLSWLRLLDSVGAYTLNFVDWCQKTALHLWQTSNQWWQAKAAQTRDRLAKLRQAHIAKESDLSDLTLNTASEKSTASEKRIEIVDYRSQETTPPTAPPPPSATPAPPPPPPQRSEPATSEKGVVIVAKAPHKPLAMTAKEEDLTLPSLSLLTEPPQSRIAIDKAQLESMSRLLESKLKDFRIDVEVESVHPGPVVTRFEIQPAPGIKVAQITNLAKDIARSLSMMSVRVVEVIPGKTTIGIEIPNENREIVYLSETIKSHAYHSAKSPLTLALGKDISGEPVAVNLAKMPHLLVAGTTGSGKSVAINTMIISILYNATPKEVRLIMVDPKMLELSIYDGIPHLLAPVVTDMKDAQNALRWCVAEMERRYKLLSKVGVRNIGGYNDKVDEGIANGQPLLDPLFIPDPMALELQVAPELDRLPFIVVIVDELADMMMVVGKKVEDLIARLAQKARAAGIHLILATQRPSVDVLTGLIKANIPTRISFQVSSRIDSRTILDQMGAESLLGNGDMLYLPPGRSVPERIHGAFVSDDEVHAVVNDLKSRGVADYNDAIINGPDDDYEGGGSYNGGEGGGGNESDQLYDQAVEIVLESRKASVSGIQRRLKIGYNRAARMVEDMEAAGVVGPLQSNGSREVLAPAPYRD
ncbi:MAG: DNA translocase FtsK 4TM domain-containing protein [Gammaproteobacteria bacterium]|nr:DNA translocase FtsK 4TM domain-containing protein [Gammaproteobacteria bacterium]